nr:uncharacterized protein LOC106783330 isoform X5 [Equus caballus]
MLTGAGCVGRCLVQDFHSVNVCRMNGVCWSQGLRESWVSAGAGDWEVPREGRAHPWGWGGRELVPGGEGSAHLPDEGFDLYSEGNGKLRAGGVTGSKWCLSISLAGHQQRTFWSKAWSKASRGGGGRQGQRGRGRVCTCPGASGQVMVMSPPPPLCRGAVHTSALSSGQSHPPARRRRERHREVENFSGTPKTREHCLLSPPRSTRTGAQLRAIRLLWRRWSEFAEVKDLRVCQLTGFPEMITRETWGDKEGGSEALGNRRAQPGILLGAQKTHTELCCHGSLPNASLGLNWPWLAQAQPIFTFQIAKQN